MVGEVITGLFLQNTQTPEGQQHKTDTKTERTRRSIGKEPPEGLERIQGLLFGVSDRQIFEITDEARKTPSLLSEQCSTLQLGTFLPER